MADKRQFPLNFFVTEESTLQPGCFVSLTGGMHVFIYELLFEKTRFRDDIPGGQSFFSHKCYKNA